MLIMTICWGQVIKYDNLLNKQTSTMFGKIVHDMLKCKMRGNKMKKKLCYYMILYNYFTGLKSSVRQLYFFFSSLQFSLPPWPWGWLRIIYMLLFYLFFSSMVLLGWCRKGRWTPGPLLSVWAGVRNVGHRWSHSQPSSGGSAWMAPAEAAAAAAEAAAAGAAAGAGLLYDWCPPLEYSESQVPTPYSPCLCGVCLRVRFV